MAIEDGSIGRVESVDESLGRHRITIITVLPFVENGVDVLVKLPEGVESEVLTPPEYSHDESSEAKIANFKKFKDYEKLLVESGYQHFKEISSSDVDRDDLEEKITELNNNLDVTQIQSPITGHWHIYTRSNNSSASV